MAAERTPGSRRNSNNKRADAVSPGDQLFTTEYISQMRLDDSEQLTGYKPIADRWVQKYNQPIQVPSGHAHTLEYDPPLLIEPPYQLAKFARPRDYVPAIVRSADQRGFYDADEEDNTWLRLHNERHKPALTLLQLERTIFELEQATYRALLRHPAAIEYDETSTCHVCGQPDSEEGNEMVFCDRCNVGVHQVCYGINSIPEGSWYCNACQRKAPVSCALCPSSGGAFKPTTNPRTWAHLVCCIWTPESVIVDTSRMEPLDLREIPRDRYNLQCVVCNTKDGSCIQCAHPTCTTAFHVTCAMQQSYRMETVIPLRGDTVDRRAFCQRHRNLATNDPEGTTLQTLVVRDSAEPVLPSLGPDFAHLIDPEALDLRDVHLDDAGRRRIYGYWILKRRRQHGKALMRRFVPPAGLARNGTTHTEEVDEEQDVYQKLQAARLSLEKARSLCVQVQRRERSKRELLCVMRQEFVLAMRAYARTHKLAEKDYCGPKSAWDNERERDPATGRLRWVVKELDPVAVQARMAHAVAVRSMEASAQPSAGTALLDDATTAHGIAPAPSSPPAGSSFSSKPTEPRASSGAMRSPGAVVSPELRAALATIVRRLRNAPFSGPFRLPIGSCKDRAGRRDLHMDLSTLLSRAEAGQYHSLEAFDRDALLLFDGCPSCCGGTSGPLAAKRKALKELYLELKSNLAEHLGQPRNIDTSAEVRTRLSPRQVSSPSKKTSVKHSRNPTPSPKARSSPAVGTALKGHSARQGRRSTRRPRAAQGIDYQDQDGDDDEAAEPSAAGSDSSEWQPEAEESDDATSQRKRQFSSSADDMAQEDLVSQGGESEADESVPSRPTRNRRRGRLGRDRVSSQPARRHYYETSDSESDLGVERATILDEAAAPPVKRVRRVIETDSDSS